MLRLRYGSQAFRGADDAHMINESQALCLGRRPPGAGGRRDHSGLVAIDRAVTGRGMVVERIEFPSAGRRRPDPPDVAIGVVRAATTHLAEQLDVPTKRIAIGGRSMGGRMCSMAVAEGLEVGALILVSYPLHPPGRPKQLRTSHFPDLHLPCLFVSGRRDAFASPAELERETAAIPGSVTLVFVDGDHLLRRKEENVGKPSPLGLARCPTDRSRSCHRRHSRTIMMALATGNIDA